MRGSNGAAHMDSNLAEYWRELLPEQFPDLKEGVNFTQTSPVDPNYNCLSWAVALNFSAFKNEIGCYWPWKHIPDDTVEGWEAVLSLFGFVRCESSENRPGYEKAAILEDENGDLHACRQGRTGKWKSKLGELGPDIDHDDLHCLKNPYGDVVRIMERQRPDWLAENE